MGTIWAKKNKGVTRNRNPFVFFGSRERIRTSDPVINSHLLCQLSYPGISPTDSNCIDTLMPINAASFYIKNNPGLSIEPQTIVRLLNNIARG